MRIITTKNCIGSIQGADDYLKNLYGSGPCYLHDHLFQVESKVEYQRGWGPEAGILGHSVSLWVLSPLGARWLLSPNLEEGHQDCLYP